MRRQSPIRDRFSQYLSSRVGKNQAQNFIHNKPNYSPTHPRHQILINGSRNNNYPQNFQSEQLSYYSPSIDSSNICFSSSSNHTQILSANSKNSHKPRSQKTKTISKRKRLTKLCDIQENTCPICLQFIKDSSQMSCGHKFCHQCLLQWLNTSSTCPYCRNDCPYYLYEGKNVLIEQKAFRYEADFPQEFIESDEDGLDYECYMCERTQQGDTVIICDRCLIHACHPECDSRIRRPLRDDEEWICHFCS